MHEYQLQGLFIGLLLVALMGMGLEIAKCGGFKEFFKNIFKRRGK